MAIFTLLLAAALLIAWFLAGDKVLAAYYRSRERALGPTERAQLARDMPLFPALPEQLQHKLLGLVSQFLARTRFVGCAGLTVTERMKNLVAAQACLLLLGRDELAYPGVSTVYLYPDDFLTPHELHLPGGVVDVREKRLSGESWPDGRVVLSWASCKRSAANPFDGENLIFHEFAHQLDQAKGQATGAPLQASLDDARAWQQVFLESYDRHCRAVELGVNDLIDGYGAQSPVEFFAVVTEVFFEKAAALAEAEPRLYEQLRQFYGLDPRYWQP
ncbi:M90 family metallopeptidase [Gallaecimonas sp. GXIMD4217]|uniref:M90 family metallopeptidase n=1 Tax=Gallaecimonas sp. GXIMD4217 TaxID=3131927 RepID=UPI00311B223C